MQPLSSFNPNLSIAILICGGAGSGKTALSMRLFPKTYVFVADMNFDSGRRYLEKIGELGNVVGYDNANPDEKGNFVVPNRRYERMWKCLEDAVKNPDVETIVLDSATFIEDIIKAKICNAAKDELVRLTGFEQWGQLMMTWKSLILQLRSSGKRIIMVAHEQKEKDESDQIFKYQIAVDGQIRAKFPALFSDVWRCKVKEANGKHSWHVDLLGNVRQEHLKNTYGFPGEMLADDLVKAIHTKA